MDYEVIVVGGGIGGLATAALLAARGVNVCLFERQSHVGGCVANFEHLGYTFEPTAGLYSGWETGETWAQIFSELPLPPPEVSKLSPNFVVRLPDGREVAVSDDRKRFEHDLAACFPDFATTAIDFFRELEHVGRRDNTVVASFLSGAPPEFRVFVDAQLQTLAQCMSAECSVARAAAVLSIAQRSMWAISGGAQALADRLAECMKQSGGTIRLDSPVLRLAYGSDGLPIGLDLLSGERVPARRAIVSNLTIWDTYGKLIGLSRTPSSISAELKKSSAWGAYLLFLSLDEAASSRLPGERLLAITETNEGHYAPDRQQLAVNIAPAWDARAPEGKRAVTVTTFTRSEDWFSFHEDQTSHDEQDQAELESVWARLHASMPELGDGVEVIESATPRSFYDNTRRKLGLIGKPSGIEGLLAPKQVFGTTPFPNVLMVGDTVTDGTGLEGVAHSARAAADFLAKLQ